MTQMPARPRTSRQYPPGQWYRDRDGEWVVTYTPAPGFSGKDSFVVTVTDNGRRPSRGQCTIPVTVQGPAVTEPAANTDGPEHYHCANTPGTSTVSPNDPDAGQTQAFSISTLRPMAPRPCRQVGWPRTLPRPDSAVTTALWSR